MTQEFRAPAKQAALCLTPGEALNSDPLASLDEREGSSPELQPKTAEPRLLKYSRIVRLNAVEHVYAAATGAGDVFENA